jgi:hypothetical protein
MRARTYKRKINMARMALLIICKTNPQQARVFYGILTRSRSSNKDRKGGADVGQLNRDMKDGVKEASQPDVGGWAECF